VPASAVLRAVQREHADGNGDEWGELSKVHESAFGETMKRLAEEDEVEPGHEDDMPRECVLNADHTDTVAKGYLIERITTLSPEKIAAVCAALSAATSCG
jgi:mRNA-degrading endonuclease toxin of MazEF toxin-antitoxin module